MATVLHIPLSRLAMTPRPLPRLLWEQAHPLDPCTDTAFHAMPLVLSSAKGNAAACLVAMTSLDICLGL